MTKSRYNCFFSRVNESAKLQLKVCEIKCSFFPPHKFMDLELQAVAVSQNTATEFPPSHLVNMQRSPAGGKQVSRGGRVCWGLVSLTVQVGHGDV